MSQIDSLLRIFALRSLFWQLLIGSLIGDGLRSKLRHPITSGAIGSRRIFVRIQLPCGNISRGRRLLHILLRLGLDLSLRLNRLGYSLGLLRLHLLHCLLGGLCLLGCFGCCLGRQLLLVGEDGQQVHRVGPHKDRVALRGIVADCRGVSREDGIARIGPILGIIAKGEHLILEVVHLDIIAGNDVLVGSIILERIAPHLLLGREDIAITGNHI